MAGCGHIGCPKGKRVKVKLKSGETVRGKFIEKLTKTILVDQRKIRKRDITSFTIDRKINLGK